MRTAGGRIERIIMSVITVSRAYGLYIEEYLRDFAEKYKYDLFSHEILMEVAKSIDKPVEKLHEIYAMDSFSSFKLFLSEMLASMSDASSVLVTGSQIDAPIYFPLYFPTATEYEKDKSGNKTYLELMKKVINDLYEKDNVIIIGRGAQIVLRDKPGVVNIRFDGEYGEKIRRVMEREDMDKSEAAEKIREIDKRRHNYIDYFYGKKVDSAELYDIIINIDRLDRDTETKLILDCIGGKR